MTRRTRTALALLLVLVAAFGGFVHAFAGAGDPWRGLLVLAGSAAVCKLMNRFEAPA